MVDLRANVVAVRQVLEELHRELMNIAKKWHEKDHGPVARPADLLHLLLHDESFQWLRPVSGLMAAVDDLLDLETIDKEDAAAVRAEVDELLEGRDQKFHPRYLQALQDTPDVVLTHARLTQAVRTLPASAPENAAELLHARHRWSVARRKRR